VFLNSHVILSIKETTHHHILLIIFLLLWLFQR